MPDQLPNITFRRGGHPNPRKTILHQQIEDVQSIPVVCLLFAHHRRADLRRIANPQFMPIVTEHLLEPLRGEGGFYADADGSRQCSKNLSASPVPCSKRRVTSSPVVVSIIAIF